MWIQQALEWRSDLNPIVTLDTDLIDTAWCLKHGDSIRMHGNGFIQLDLPDDHRLHIWHQALGAAQESPTPIHDHTFDFHSKIVGGTLINIVYGVSSYGRHTHSIYEAVTRERQDTKLVPTAMGGTPYIETMCAFERGETYRSVAGMFHATAFVGYAITVIKKGPRNLGMSPRVLVPKGKEPDNLFTRFTYGEKLLWIKLNMAMNEIGRGASK